MFRCPGVGNVKTALLPEASFKPSPADNADVQCNQDHWSYRLI